MWCKCDLGHGQIGIIHHQSVSFRTCLGLPQRFSSANCKCFGRLCLLLSDHLSCCASFGFENIWIRASMHHNLSPHEASRFGFLYRVPHLQISVDAFLERTWHQPASVSFAPKDLHRMEQHTSVFACIGLYRLHVFLTRFSAPQNSTFFTAVQLKTKRIVGSLDQIMKGGEPPVEPFQWFEYILMVSSRKHGAIGRWHFDTLCICSGYPYRMFWWDFASNVFHAGSICEGSKLLLQQGLWELGLIVGPRVKSQMQYRPSLQNYFFQALSWIGQQTGCASPFSAMCCLTSWATTRNCVMMTCQLL